MAKPIQQLQAHIRDRGALPIASIHQCVDRYHVSRSLLDIGRRWWQFHAAPYDRPIKRAIVRVALKRHLRNIAEYNFVTRCIG